MNEQELVKLSQNGDTNSFSALILPYEQRLFHHAYRMLSNEAEAEDAVQEALLKAWQKIHTYHGNAAFSTWLYTILHRVCLDMLRKEKRRAPTISLNLRGKDEEEFALSIPDSAPGPDEKVNQKAALRAVANAIDTLSDEHRTVIILRDIDGLDYDEIAKVTNTSLGTVKSRINRARLALRNILKDQRELFE